MTGACFCECMGVKRFLVVLVCLWSYVHGVVLHLSA